jgi:DNA helicase-2/ATP-dependent DNA helicase PcrA
VRAARTAEGLEEERRLFYVAATRAKDELLLVHPLAAFDRYGIVVVTEPSRFLNELPEDVYERWVLEPGPPLPEVAGANAPRLGEAEDPTVEDDPEDLVN